MDRAPPMTAWTTTGVSHPVRRKLHFTDTRHHNDCCVCRRIFTVNWCGWWWWWWRWWRWSSQHHKSTQCYHFRYATIMSRRCAVCVITVNETCKWINVNKRKEILLSSIYNFWFVKTRESITIHSIFDCTSVQSWQISVFLHKPEMNMESKSRTPQLL